MHKRTAVLVALALALCACGPLGKVEQGRVVGYDRQTRRVTLIPEDPDAQRCWARLAHEIRIVKIYERLEEVER